MKFRNLLENILTEASKKDVLINKLGIKKKRSEINPTFSQNNMYI